MKKNAKHVNNETRNSESFPNKKHFPNSHAKVQSTKTTNMAKVQYVMKQNKSKTSPRWIPTAKYLESRNNNKSSTVHKNVTNPRPCHKWIPSGRMFKDVGLRWIPIGKLFTNGKIKVDRETPKGLDTNVTNQYICNKACNVSAGTR